MKWLIWDIIHIESYAYYLTFEFEVISMFVFTLFDWKIAVIIATMFYLDIFLCLAAGRLASEAKDDPTKWSHD